MRKLCLVVLALSASLVSTEILAADPPAQGDRSAACDRACLEGYINQYLEALAARDPSRLPLADDVVFVENQQVLKLGDGLWRTVTGLGKYRHYFADPEMGQAGLIGVVEESGTKIIFDMRLAIADGKIKEIETLAIRSPATLYEEHGAPAPKFLETIPPEQRLPREELARIANKYFTGMQGNDPKGDYTFFHPQCDRWEHGLQTTNKTGVKYGHVQDTEFAAMSCREQFQTGFLGFVTRIRDRRFAVVDVERQTVLAFAQFDHNGTVRELHMSNGKTSVVPPYFSSPRTLSIGEAWRIEDGMIRQIEATLNESPYGMRPAFPSGDAWVERTDIANKIAAAPSSDPCDRACLDSFVDKFLDALVAHDAKRLPVSPDVKYTENGQRLPLYDGLWGTATERGNYGIRLADPTSGTVGWYGTIVETGVPGVLAVRLKVADRRVTEIEAVITRRETRSAGGGTMTMMIAAVPYQNDPADFTSVDPVFATAAGATAEDLVKTTGAYFDALGAGDGARAALAEDCIRRANGVRLTDVADAAAPDPAHPDYKPTALGCAEQISAGYFGEIEAIREVRPLVVDSERGLVLSHALYDVPHDRKTIPIKGVGDVAVTRLSTGPYSILAAQLFKVDNGRIRRVEEQLRTVPYRMPSGWEN
ncbi:MAG: hypothetical protein EPO31_05600 [Gammaproteobacteria bacterium]|nr:MAG: hypothetical protein EPO31_05600 [Gammaproteobacteria bacterium]